MEPPTYCKTCGTGPLPPMVGHKGHQFCSERCKVAFRKVAIKIKIKKQEAVTK